MAYLPHTLVQFGGGLSSQTHLDDIWSCTIRGVKGGNLPLASPAAYMEVIAGPLATWFAQAQVAADACNLRYVKVNNIGANGRYSDGGNTNLHQYGDPPNGAAAQTAPMFCSIAITWRTAKQRGRGSHGRIYLPNPIFPVSIGSAITTAAQNAVSNRGKELLELLNVSGGDETFIPCVLSKLAGTADPIVNVQVGDVYDFQSRRKNANHELYVSRSFP